MDVLSGSQPQPRRRQDRESECDSPGQDDQDGIDQYDHRNVHHLLCDAVHVQDYDSVSTSHTVSKRQVNRVRKKEAKSRHILRQHEGITASITPTMDLYVGNGGLGNGISREVLFSWLSQYGSIRSIVMIPGKPYAFVRAADADTACKIASLSGSKVLHDGIIAPIEHYICFVDKVPESTLKHSAMDECLPDGMLLIEDIVSEEYEQMLLTSLQWGAQADIAGSQMKHRSVQHFGYEFKYDTNNVDPDEPLQQCIPESCQFFINTLLGQGILTEAPDQLTVNKYEPGQGIPPHVDTHTAFLEPIISLSLGSQTVMTFTHPNGQSCSVLLPRRSAIVMRGASRYVWSHGIIPRKNDVVETANGLTLLKRGTRVSFTFRKLRRAPCTCIYRDQCDSQKREVSHDLELLPQELSSIQLLTVENPLEKLTEQQASSLEHLHVHQVYDAIAEHFSDTRHTQWPKVAQFVTSLEPGTVMLDVGCGNGKYLGASRSIFKLGIERSLGLAEICQQRAMSVCLGDCLHIPLRDASVDACLSIAVIHHLSTKKRRLQAIYEMIRVLRRAGRCLIYVWAMEQRKNQVNSKYLKAAADPSPRPECCCTLGGYCPLPVHKNRTEFFSSDMLVPWNRKTASTETKSSNKDCPIEQITSVPSCEDDSTSELPKSWVPKESPLRPFNEILTNTDGKTVSKTSSCLCANHITCDTITGDRNLLNTTSVSLCHPQIKDSSENSGLDMNEGDSISDKQADVCTAPKLYHRYYHLFRQGELEQLCQEVASVDISDSYYDQGNWCVVLVKT